jgi:hypothetical protein
MSRRKKEKIVGNSRNMIPICERAITELTKFRGLFRMQERWIVFLFALLFSFGLTEKCHGQNPLTDACAVFAADGGFATGTLRNGDLETKLNERGAVVATVRVAIGRSPFLGLSQRCEETFSTDGRWLATVVPSDELTVVIFDRKAQTVHRNFSSKWYRFHDMPIEPGHRSSFLGGFLQDDSLVLWRYVPRAVANAGDASNADLHLQRWSVEGQLLSDQNLGGVGFGPGGRQPIVFNEFNLLWIPNKCEVVCYRGVKASEGQFADAGTLKLPNDNATQPVTLPGDEGLLSVLGERTGQRVVVLDLSGRLEAQVSLPFFPNLLGPLVPDWFAALTPTVSHDGKVAAVGRTRVAWVLVDTDRDWGSEIVLLRMHPLAVTAKLKTGKGGIGAMAVDHRNGIVRIVAFWGGRWHELRCDDEHPSECHDG